MRIKASGFTGIMLEEAQANKARVSRVRLQYTAH